MRLYIIAAVFILFYAFDVVGEIDDNKTIVETITFPFSINNLYDDISASAVRIDDGDGNRVFVPVVLYRVDKSNYFLTFYLYQNFRYGNYSIILNNVKTINNSILISGNFTYNYNIARTNSSLRIDPNVLFLEETNNPFDVLVSSYDVNGGVVDVNLSIMPNTEILGENVIIANLDSKKLESLSLHNLEVLVRNIKTYYIGKIVLTISEKSYEIPLYSKDFVEIPKNLSASKRLIFVNDKEYINLSFGYGQTVTGGGGKVFIKNDGGLRIDRINIELRGNIIDVLSLENTTISGLDLGGEAYFFIYVNKNLDAGVGEYSGDVKVSYDDGEISLPVYVSVLQRAYDVNESLENITQLDQNKSVEPSTQEKKDNTPLLLLGAIFLVIFIFGLIFFRKQKKKGDYPDDNKKFEEIIEKYSGK